MPKFTITIDEPVQVEVTYDIESGQAMTRDQPYIPDDIEVTGVKLVNWKKLADNREIVMGAFDHMYSLKDCNS